MKQIKLPHEHGGIIVSVFNKCAPVSPLVLKKMGYIEDYRQEINLVAIELEKETDIKFLSNYTQKKSYSFFKNIGFRKKRIGKNSVWYLPQF